MGPPIPQYIPFDTIDRYANRFHIEDFEEFYTLIKALDDAWMEKRQEAAAQE